MKKSWIIIGIIIAVSFIVSIAFFSQVPQQMPSHWNLQGQVDGYISKTWGLFLVPVLLIGLSALFFIVPKADPMKENVKSFQKYFDAFIIVLFLFLLSIHVQTILWSIGIKIRPNTTFPIGIGILLFTAGFIMQKTKRNWFMGIRTPWTLSSDTVWQKTHHLGGKLFKLAGLLSFVGVFFPNQAFYFVLIPILLVTLITILYSYLVYQKETKKVG